MQGEAFAVVQEEESGAWLYVAKVGGEILTKSFLVDRTDAELVADAVFGAHEFGASLMCQLICLVNGRGTCKAVDFFGKSVCDILLVCDLSIWNRSVALPGSISLSCFCAAVK